MVRKGSVPHCDNRQQGRWECCLELKNENAAGESTSRAAFVRLNELEAPEVVEVDDAEDALSIVYDHVTGDAAFFHES